MVGWWEEEGGGVGGVGEWVDALKCGWVRVATEHPSTYIAASGDTAELVVLGFG